MLPEKGWYNLSKTIDLNPFLVSAFIIKTLVLNVVVPAVLSFLLLSFPFSVPQLIFFFIFHPLQHHPQLRQHQGDVKYNHMRNTIFLTDNYLL